MEDPDQWKDNEDEEISEEEKEEDRKPIKFI